MGEDMATERIRECILRGKTALGIELGSTRIKAVLIDENHMPIASGTHDWENRLENGLWTYRLSDVWEGLQKCYKGLADSVQEQYQTELTRVGCIGFSAMMHGYLVFDREGELLVPFRTWRNTVTEQASRELTELFSFHIPQRWSIAHLYQAVLNGEEHVERISYMTTLAGYVHWMLTGEKVLGIGEASGMFPINSETKQYDSGMLDKLQSRLEQKQVPVNIREILPKVLLAGESAGVLTGEGAKLLDPSGKLCAGIPLCPPEGDAGTGMTATNSVAVRTGNVSAGTSIFAMTVLEKELKGVYDAIDMVTTPSGFPVAMVHCNNCTSDLNDWAAVFGEFAKSIGAEISQGELFGLLYRKALEGDADAGGLLAYNYVSGEHITGFEEGRPLFVRTPQSRFNLANFIRTHLYTALGAIRMGMDILFEKEQVQVDLIFGHGGLFKTPEVGQRFLAAALNTPVAVMETAGEGGAWGMALLAAFSQNRDEKEELEEYLSEKVFGNVKSICLTPDKADVAGFTSFYGRYREGLEVERAAVRGLSE